MKRLIVATSLVTILFASGCTQYEDGKCVKNCGDTVEAAKESGTIKEALKKFKQGKVADYTDARETNKHISVMIDFSESVGARTQAGGTISNTDSFIKVLKDKPETVTVSARYQGVKVLQFTKDVKSGELTLESAHKDIEDYLKQSGYIK